MDAKKARKHFKPIYFNDTKAGVNSSLISFGVVVFSLALGYLYHLSATSRPDRLYTNNPIARWVHSEEYKVFIALMKGYVPPPNALRKKYEFPEGDNLIKGTSGTD